MSAPSIELGIGRNLAQFSLLVVVNAFVGAMIDDRLVDIVAEGYDAGIG